MLTYLILILLSALSAFSQEKADSLDVQLGEKLFLEDRFSHSFFQNHKDQVNKEILKGDPILDVFEILEATMDHPQKGRQVSCSSCHLVNQVSEIKENLVFTYNDFSVQSKVPMRKDFVTRTTRNSMNMVLSATQKNTPLHWDGEFFSPLDLACAALVGRNMGWQNSEAQKARDHIVKVLRFDNGEYGNSSDLKDPYLKSFLDLGYDFKKMSDAQVYTATCEVMGQYMESLDFLKDSTDQFIGSAYDQFLQKNNIRRSLLAEESDRGYLQYLRDQFNLKTDWIWVGEEKLNFHNHNLKFGESELKGLKIFLGKAQCATCHSPPSFTNYGFHGTGISQLEYEKIHGKEQFKKLYIPSGIERNKNKRKYFVASESHPSWTGLFRNKSTKDHIDWIDLGVWNILGHPDKLKVQEQIKKTICLSQRRKSCDWDDEIYLNYTVAAFKTPTLRSLGQSKPYFHNGEASSLDDVLKTYQDISARAKTNDLLNADPLLKIMDIKSTDIEFLKSFLESLDEDYN